MNTLRIQRQRKVLKYLLLRKKFKVCVKVQIKKTNKTQQREGTDVQDRKEGGSSCSGRAGPVLWSKCSPPDRASVGRRRLLGLQLMSLHGSFARVSTRQINSEVQRKHQ